MRPLGERLLGGCAKEDYKATLELDCMDRANLLSDVALALGDMRVPIYSLSARAAGPRAAHACP